MSETFVVTKQQKEQLTEFLEKVDKEIAPNKIPTKEAASILGLQNEDVDSSVSTYLASSGIEKLFYIINVIYLTTVTTYISYIHSFLQGKSNFRNEAFNLIAMFCRNPKNHSLLIKLGILNELFKEIDEENSPVIITCISALADLANVQENRDALRSNGCTNNQNNGSFIHSFIEYIYARVHFIFFI